MRTSTVFVLLAALAAVAVVWKTSGPGPALASVAPPGANGMQNTWGLEILNPIAADKRNISLPIANWRLDGFENALTGNHRTASVTRTGPNASISATVPASGTFHPAFVLYDTRGNERVGVFVDGVQVGTAVADWDNNRERLFFLTEVRTFKGGETIELRALDAEGTYRIEALLLLGNTPAPRPYAYSFSEVAAQPDQTQATITWITSWPATCTVEWTADGARGSSTVVETVAANNHRLILRNLAARSSFRFRVSAVSREGAPVVTGWQTFSTRPRAPVSGTAKIRRVPLVARDDVSASLDEEMPVCACRKSHLRPDAAYSCGSQAAHTLSSNPDAPGGVVRARILAIQAGCGGAIRRPMPGHRHTPS